MSARACYVWKLFNCLRKLNGNFVLVGGVDHFSFLELTYCLTIHHICVMARAASEQLVAQLGSACLVIKPNSSFWLV